MKYLIVFLLAASLNRAVADSLPEDRVNKIANAIYKLEGGAKTRYPYGIKSVQTANPREVCKNTIRNNYARWQKAGSKGNYLDFLGDRYCPKSSDSIGNYNWKKNIHKLVDN